MEENYTYIDSSGFRVEGQGRSGKDFVDAFREASEKSDKDIAIWIKKLQKIGIKAAHPNDGWNNREECSFQLVYPYFSQSLKVGDQVALGDPESYVVLTIVKVRKSVFGSITYSYQDYK